MTEDSLGVIGTIGAILGSGAIGSLLRGWWTARKEKRADAVESANANAQLNMLENLERRAKEAEAEADRERTERLKAERAQVQAEAKLYVAASDIVRLERRLERAGVPHSDYGRLIETNFGSLPEIK